MLSTEGRFTFKRKGLLQHTVYQKVSALARLAFYLLILKETSAVPGGGGGRGVLLAILGVGVPPGSPNPEPISDQKM